MAWLSSSLVRCGCSSLNLSAHRVTHLRATRVRSLLRWGAFLAFSLIGFLPVDSVQAQTTTGLPPFSTIHDSIFDDVKINDGAVLLHLPVWNKPGIIPFSYSLVFNNTVGINSALRVQTGAWSPQTSVGLTRGLTWTESATPFTCGAKGHGVQLSNFQIIDGFGGVHSVPTIKYDSLQCFSPTLSGSANDSSGYSLTVADPYIGGGSGGTIRDRAGNTFSGLTAGPNVFTDPNGNVLSYAPASGNPITFTDPTGLNPMTESLTYTNGQISKDTNSWTDPSGNTQSVVINYSVYTQKTNFGCADPQDILYPAQYLASSLSTPEGAYTISYEATSGGYTGRISQITFPSGASIQYTYTSGSNGLTCLPLMVPVLTRTVTDANGTVRQWKYDTTQATNETIVTDPTGNETVYLFWTTNVPVLKKSVYETQRQVYQGTHLTGSLMETVLTCYDGNTTNCANPTTQPPTGILQKDVYTTLRGMTQSSHSETTYDLYGNLTEDKEYDFNGTLISDRALVYGTYSNGSCTALANFSNRVCSDTTTASGNVLAQIYNTYDTRGNRTLASALVSGAGNGSGTYLSSSTTYNTNGTVQYSYDTNLNRTAYTYGACNGTMPTLVQESIGSLSKSMTWNCAGGVPVTATDENGQVTQYKYISQSSGADPFWRLVEADYPDGGQRTTTYNDTAMPPNIVTSQLMGSGLTLTAQTTFDGLGHSIQSSLTSDPEGATSTVKAYDAMERLGTVYNPTRCSPPTTNCGENTWGMTNYSYDALNRPSTVTESDGSQITTTYAGNCATVTDEAGKARQSCTDALGRTTSVWEDPGATPHLNLETDYVYDALGNLLNVTQKGPPGSSSGSWRTRSFLYDSLSRIISATNPESGTKSYSYFQLSGALCSGDPKAVCWKTAPSPNQISTGTARVTTTYTYDALNRLTGTSYSDAYTQNPATPAVTYGYDGANLSNCPTPIGFYGGSGTNTLGRRTAMCFGSGSKSWSYDSMGRVQTENDQLIGLVPPYNSAIVYTPSGGVPTISTDINYAYYLNGDLEIVYSPADYEFYNQENSAGRVTSAGDTTFNVLTNATYTPGGQLATGVVGRVGGGYAGTTISNAYNDRLQPVSALAMTGAAPPVAILNRTYNFNLGNGTTGSDNGNVIQIANGTDGNRTQNFLYDSLNRIQQAYSSGPNWGETYSPFATAPGVPPTTPGIDPWGNLTNRSGVTGKSSFESLNCPANTQNQLTTCAFLYDPTGNMTHNGGVTYTYDAENRLIATGGYSYLYDGDGQRVEKCTAGATLGTCASNAAGTFYWQAGGGTVAESDLGGNFTAAYGLIRGQIASRIDLPSRVVHYYFHDHLGSTSIVTDAVGNIVKESDYYPYGGEIPISGSDLNRYKFTGKERDSESGLDNFVARYDSSSLGRFMTPDEMGPGQHLDNPQSWNLYSYVMNKPLTLTDPTGQYVCDSKTVSASQCDNFQASLDQAQKAASALKGSQQTDAQRAIDAYGTKGVDNGVTIAQGKVGADQAETSVSQTVGPGTKDNPNGQNITVTFDKASDLLNGKNLDAVGSLSGHEGVHVADASDWVSSGFSDSAHPSNLQTEHDAYTVQMNILQGLGHNSATFSFGGKDFTFSLPLTSGSGARIDAMIKRSDPRWNLDAWTRSTTAGAH
jgi:RHS repeat-associated protein